MTANEDQIALWNETAGHEWVALQVRMDASLADMHDALLALAAAQPGEAVLDIGCGTGTTTLALADAVGTNGRVTGLDVSRPMLALAAARRNGRASITLTQGDAATQAFANDYDLLFSRFGVMFFDDPIGAFANLHRAARPGGRLAFVCWRDRAENPWATAPLEAARAFLPPMPPQDAQAPGPFAFADPQRVLSILTDVGFHEVEIVSHDGVMHLGSDLDEAAAHMLRVGPLARAAAGAGPDILMPITAAVKRALKGFRRPDGEIAPPTACWLVTAKVQ